MNSKSINLRTLLLVAGALSVSTAAATELQLDGYAEPFQTIRVGTDETGTIAEVMVREGQKVSAGQPLVRLNSDILKAALAVAAQNMRAQGRLAAARADAELRRSRLEKLRALLSEGHARHEEVDRAAMQQEVAAAQLVATQEEQAGKRLQYDKIKTQIDRRTICAPVEGVVIKLHKQPGEFAAPNSPDVATVVRIDKLLVNFSLQPRSAKQLQQGQQIEVEFLEGKVKTKGTVDLISPVTDAESGTVLIKILVDNSDGELRSGERCRVRLESR